MSSLRLVDPWIQIPLIRMSIKSELQQLPLLIKWNVVLLGLLLLTITVLLWPVWKHNPDLSHGLFMPVLFLLLLNESRKSGANRYLTSHPIKTFVTIFILLTGITAISSAGLFSVSVGWNHSLVSFCLTIGTAAVFFAGLLVLSDGDIRFIPINWTSLLAVGLWILCAPIPPGTYSRLTLSLQLMVTEHVLTALHFLGIAASRHGNIIELANTSVGVAEACSGARSLISCIFAGLFFSATLVRRPWARALIVLLSAPIALGMNFIRSLTLTLLANRGVDITGMWHDLTGFAVLGVTAIILGVLAILLEQETQTSENNNSTVKSSKPRMLLPVSLNVSIILIASLGVLFFVNTRAVNPANKAPPQLLAVLPSTAEGWHVKTSNDLYQFSGILETESLAQRTYLKHCKGDDIQLTVYLAYWEAGRSSVSQVAMHTPDACWPGAGWEVSSIETPRQVLQLPTQTLPVAEAREFKSGGRPQYVWFWHIYNGRSIAYEDPYSPVELLRNAWRYGFTRHADQLFVRVSSNLPWDQLKDEPLLSEIFENTKPLGL
jgi:exosortase